MGDGSCHSSASSCRTCTSTGTYGCPSNLDRSSIFNIRAQRLLPSDVIVMRHSERVDDLFPGWTKQADDKGNYSPYDLNMPPSLPIRRPLSDYSLDTPITVNGTVLAKMIGRGLLLLDKSPDVIYCSPALRCLQTAATVRDLAAAPKALLRVEPALFENPHLYSSMPTLATREQREQFKVDEGYLPTTRFKDVFKRGESIEEYNKRIRDVLLRIASTAEPVREEKKRKRVTALVVGHASTVDLAVGWLSGVPRKTTLPQLHRIGDRIPYCATLLFTRTGSVWNAVPDGIPPVTYRNFTNRVVHDFVFRPV